MIFKRLFLVMLITTTFLFIELFNATEFDDYNKFVKAQDNIQFDIEMLSDDSYEKYKTLYDMVRPDSEYILNYNNIDLLNSTGFDINESTSDFGGSYDKMIFSYETGKISWTIDVETAGYYNFALMYYPIVGKSSSIERAIYINGEVPYEEAEKAVFSRIWINATNDFIQDTGNNDIVPKQIEAPRWVYKTITDSSGLYSESLLFHLEAGTNTITLESIKEPVIIDYLKIFQEEEVLNYEDYLENAKDKVDQAPDGYLKKIQGEKMYEKSTPTLYPFADRTSPRNEPQHHSQLKLNAGGGYNWRMVGDWISYEIEAPNDGFYKISMRAKQNYLRGAYVTRNLKIDGKVPFEEASNIAFLYSNNWDLYTLGDGNVDYEFYLEKGTHIVTFEVVLGDFSESTRIVQEVIKNLNELYRQIIMITSTTPDLYRDYELTKRLPHLLDDFSEQAELLEEVSNGLYQITGESSDKTVILDKVAYQLRDFIDKPDTIHKRLSNFQGNISALGTWVLQIKEQPLAIDYIMLHTDNAEMPKIKAGFFERIWFEIKAFFASFFVDYNNLSTTGVTGNEGSITVWVSTGRDQANVVRRLIDESFTVESDINVDLKLVPINVLLPATFTGNGPDIVMGVNNQIPVNYAMRNAVYDLTNFDDFEEVITRFNDSAMTPYHYEEGYYALPETQLFPVMFYREDILNELGLEVPQTWDDVIKMVPELQRYNLEFYLPIEVIEASQGVIPPNIVFLTLLYQNGGNLYNEDGTLSALQEKLALETFKQWTDFYTNYKFPIQANFVNRFRSGEMPIGIAYYNMYNTLAVFAPEISGDWKFTYVPGTMQEDGTINRTVPTQGTGSIMLKQAKDKDLAWEYLKWWTREDVQVKFGREMEGILGPAARYPTANMQALEKLPWPAEDYQILSEQWESTVGIPEVPGGYFTGRHIDNALRKVINTGTNPRETLYEYAEIINEEIRNKRKEFGLDE